jgi:hypothetical protein
MQYLVFEHLRKGLRRGWFGLVAFGAMVSASPGARAATLGQTDVAVALYASAGGTSWTPLSGSTLSGFFGPHRCACPDTLSVQLQLTSSGQTNLGNSTIGVSFFLGQNCLATTASCVQLGQVTFSAAVSATSPTFNSSLVYASASGATSTCTALTAGTTTLWAVLTQDGVPLPFVPTLDLSVITATVAAPTAVATQPSNQGLLISWTPPKDASLVAGYQVLCLPHPTTASTVGYETCGLTTVTDATVLTTGDVDQVCSSVLPASATSVRLSGLDNGTTYTVAVVAIDPSGATSALSPVAQGTPVPTSGFMDRYKNAGGEATGCSLSKSHRTNALVLLAVVIVLLLLWRAHRSPRRRGPGGWTYLPLLLLALPSEGRSQSFAVDHDDDWGDQKAAPHMFQPPDWGFEVGLSLYRPAVDSEFRDGARPYADTFGSGRHLLWEAELDRYLLHRVGTLGVGLRVGFYRVTAAAFLEDGVTRSGDETSLQLIPFSLSVFYKADGLPGLRLVPLTPYVKAGLDGVSWRSTNTGANTQVGFSPGWHAAAGLMLGLNSLGSGIVIPGTLADPCALFFEWDYAAINGLGMGQALHVGDNTWYAGLMFDL